MEPEEPAESEGGEEEGSAASDDAVRERGHRSEGR